MPDGILPSREPKAALEQEQQAGSSSLLEQYLAVEKRPDILGAGTERLITILGSILLLPRKTLIAETRGYWGAATK